MMVIGNEYKVVIGEEKNGTLIYEEAKLIEIKNFEGKEIYVFSDMFGEKYYDYKRSVHENIDWEFIAILHQVEA